MHYRPISVKTYKGLLLLNLREARGLRDQLIEQIKLFESRTDELEMPFLINGFITSPGIYALLAPLYLNGNQLRNHAGKLHGRLVSGASRGLIELTMRCGLCRFPLVGTKYCQNKPAHPKIKYTRVADVEISATSVAALSVEDFMERAGKTGPGMIEDFKALKTALERKVRE